MEANEADHTFRDAGLELGTGRPIARDGPSTMTKQALLFGRSVREHHDGDVLKVSTRSRPSAVAGAIAGVIRENGSAEVQSIGAGATNQAIKAVAIARSYLREEGVDIVCVPSFIDVEIDEEERTAIRILIEKRPV